ncbi:ABC transporter permease [Streptomyces sp. NPDC003393]
MTAPSLLRHEPTTPHHAENITSARHGPSTRQAVLTPIMVGLIIGTLFVAVFLAAFHAPEPRNLPVGIVGPTQNVETVERTLQATTPGAITLTTYPTAAAARNAVEHRHIYGAYVITSDGARASLLEAGANGPAVTSTLHDVFRSVATASQTPLTTHDVTPTSAGDTRGLSTFYASFGLVLAGYLFGVASHQMAPRLSTRLRLASLTAFSAVGGTTTALIVGTTGFNALPGNLLAVAAVTTLLAMSVGAATLLIMRAAGSAATLLAPALLLILGNATSGGTLPPEYLPSLLRPLSGLLPVGLGVRALQGTSYFHGAGYLRGITVLTVWVLTSMGLILVLNRATARRATASPATPSA